MSTFLFAFAVSFKQKQLKMNRQISFKVATYL